MFKVSGHGTAKLLLCSWTLVSQRVENLNNKPQKPADPPGSGVVAMDLHSIPWKISYCKKITKESFGKRVDLRFKTIASFAKVMVSFEINFYVHHNVSHMLMMQHHYEKCSEIIFVTNVTVSYNDSGYTFFKSVKLYLKIF